MYDGILNVYKEKGYTSFDVCAKLRGILGQKKIGHTGTLDPEAEGVLIVCAGKATKLVDMLTDHEKVYRATILLGTVTDTQDMTGSIVGKYDTSGLTEDRVISAILSFIGTYDQIPPMYSAVHSGGKRLYELAREGIEVERKPREVTIDDIGIESVDLPEAVFTVKCSKGTYIRTLCSDIGKKLGVGGCMKDLVRLRVGEFSINDSLTLKELEELKDAGRLPEAIIPAEEIFKDLRSIRAADKTEDNLVRNGNPLRPDQKNGLKEGEMFRVYDLEGDFIGIYEYNKEKRMICPRTILFGGTTI